jgi:hypothetical protein
MVVRHLHRLNKPLPILYHTHFTRSFLNTTCRPLQIGENCSDASYYSVNSESFVLFIHFSLVHKLLMEDFCRIYGDI